MIMLNNFLSKNAGLAMTKLHARSSVERGLRVTLTCYANFKCYTAPEAYEGSGQCVMGMPLYSLAFMDDPCTLGATVCH